MSNCVQPGCPGSYGPHGYCDECGHKAPTADSPPAPVPASTPSSGRLRSRPSGRVSTPVISGRSTTSRPGKIGDGWVDIPRVPPRDPATTGLPVPEIPESQRFCRTCNEPVGRERDGRPGLTRGFCPRDRTRFSFAPTLSKGDCIDRYEIDHCIARGGQGWIYLARDTHLEDHLVVLKGLIDTGDKEAVEQAVQERRYLIDVSHSNIVKINDFVQHPDPLTGTMAGYIVMEYIDGLSLLQLHRNYRDDKGKRAQLPLSHVLAYGMAVLRAMGHLHEMGLLYCDFKPDNAMQTGDELKLIDLGAVVRADRLPKTFMGTLGYQAPEVEDTGPTIASDLYTVGRTLAVLGFKFDGFSGHYRHNLPERSSDQVLIENESFYRLLCRATHPSPERRFSSAEEMRGQAEGVLLEVLSAADQQARPSVSTWFSVERRTFGTDAGSASTEDTVDWATVGPALPAPLVDPRDPGAGYLAAIAAADPDDVIDTLLGIPVNSAEVVLQLAGARIAAGDLDAARTGLDEYAETAPHDWRVAWYRGVAALAAGSPAEARAEFEKVYDALPGELPPKLALAASAEWDGDDRRAGPLYERVWHTDNRFLSAAFGFARVSGRSGDLPAVVDALEGVPEEHKLHVPAKILVLNAALEWVRDNKDPGIVFGLPLEDRPLRFGLEKAYRDLAKVTEDADRRITLVKAANKVRPRTLF